MIDFIYERDHPLAECVTMLGGAQLTGGTLEKLPAERRFHDTCERQDIIERSLHSLITAETNPTRII